MKFQYCPYCRSKLEEKENTYICKEKKHIIHIDSIPAVSTVPIKDNKILLATRGKDPQKGKLDVIGGFTEPGEHPEKTAIRETKEETDMDIEILDFIGIYMDKYTYKGNTNDVMNIYYIVKAHGEPNPADDVSEIKWYDLDDLPESEFAFDHLKHGLADVKKWLDKNSF